jgi:2-methylisocitrate lyase-like PEP mutase family enzyme
VFGVVANGATPDAAAEAFRQRSAAELGARGFRIVIFPGGTARAVAHALQAYYGSLNATGSTAAWRERMLDFDGLNDLIGTPGLLETGRRYE